MMGMRFLWLVPILLMMVVVGSRFGGGNDEEEEIGSRTYHVLILSQQYWDKV